MTLETLEYYWNDMQARAPYISDGLEVEMAGDTVRILNQKHPNTSVLIKLDDNLVICPSGSRTIQPTRWKNEFLNAPQGKLLRDTIYQLDGGLFRFGTDEYGRVNRIRVRLRDGMAEQHALYRGSKGPDATLVQLVGSIGPLVGPVEAINLFRMEREKTQKFLRSMESSLSEAIVCGKPFRLTWQADVRYPAPLETRPSEFRIRVHLMTGTRLRLQTKMDYMIRNE